MKLPVEEKDTEQSLAKLLVGKYKSPEWALFRSVRSAAGFDANRTCDALAMGLWPSRGLELHGFEIKCSRQDLQTELKDPAKAETFARYCDYWWIVAAPNVVGAITELPGPWGLLERTGKRLIVRKEAVVNIAPVHIDRSFLAAICKRAIEHTPDEVTDAVRAALQGAKAEYERAHRYALEAHRELAAQVSEFEKASGLSISGKWDKGDEIGRTVRSVMNGGFDRHERALERVLAMARQVTENIEADIAQLKNRG